MKRVEVNKRYLNRQKLLCRFAGVWPYETYLNRKLAQTILCGIALSSLCTQIVRVKVFFSPDILIEQCPFLVAGIGIPIKIANYALNYEKNWLTDIRARIRLHCSTLLHCSSSFVVRQKSPLPQWWGLLRCRSFRAVIQLLLYVVNSLNLADFVNDMYNDWDEKRPPAEIEIMDIYGKRGVFFTIVYLATAVFGTFVFITLPTAASVVVYFTRKENGTVTRYYIYPAHYPFDEDKYYIYFWAHMVVVILTVVIVFSACDTLYIYCVQHGCGLLAVAGYRFKTAVENYASGQKESVKTMDIAYKRICVSVQGYQRALRFIQDIQALHSTYLAISIVLIITAFSITLVKISMTELGLEFYKYLGFLVIQLIHLLFVTSQGQFVQNAYDEIYNEMYAGQWYSSSRKTQMLYLLALRETLTAPILSAGGLLPLTMETFAEVLKTSISYFTVLKSQ